MKTKVDADALIQVTLPYVNHVGDEVDAEISKIGNVTEAVFSGQNFYESAPNSFMETTRP